ncbi:MAG: hypothetical protein JWL80_533 [Parcubacteria group bacterium]|nr:hypothetical protein [Parcubacteria group bacterium]
MKKQSILLASKKEKRLFSFLGGLLLIILALSYIFGGKIQRDANSSPTKTAANPFDKVHVVAKAAYVYDVRTGEVLYSKNPDTRIPLASLTKVMTALVATDLASNNSTITVSDAAVQTEGDSGLIAGERFSLKNLLDFSLTSSSNDGMAAVAISLGDLHSTNSTAESSIADFVTTMNKKANALGMKNTYYFNPTGLDETEHKGGAYGTAKDMSILFSYIITNKPYLLTATTQSAFEVPSLDHTIHVAHNTDALVNDIPGLKGSKTGFTDLAGGNLIVAFDPEIGRPIVISVLGSTEADRFQDVSRLVKTTFAYLHRGDAVSQPIKK